MNRLLFKSPRFQVIGDTRRPDIRIAAAIALLNQAGALPAVRRILSDEFGNASECRRIVDALAQADRYHPLLLELLPLRTGFFAETAAGELVRTRCA
ncbi:MAG: hypothetical protein IT186_21960, partial [Acidobacteria bacterium]|nr:hypothetical protein [Acidobacteriota bacterium]